MTIRHVAAVAVVLVAACGGDDEAVPAAPTTSAPESRAGAQVASYDLAANLPQRFLVGVLGGDGGVLVGGDVSLDFTFFGADPSSESGDEVPSITDVTATFTPVALTREVEEASPRLSQSGEAGVYEATGVVFDRPGFWGVQVTAQVDGAEQIVDAAFEVLGEHQIPTAGSPAPRTVNLLPGDPEAPVGAVDSRAAEDGSVPDPELHELTVADAIATGRPTLLVVSTPVYCVSRFCGPITDAVQRLAGRIGDAANFVHIEVWRDFEEVVLNRAAAEWIFPSEDVDAKEPWVFLIDGTGTVVERWDNVTNEPELEAAVRSLIG